MSSPSLHNNPGFHLSLLSIKPNSPNSSVQVMWSAILGTWFRSRDSIGYQFFFQPSTLATEDASNVVFQVIEVTRSPEEPSGFAQRQILMVECKCPFADTPEVWEESARRQLPADISTYLTNASPKVIGVVCIGTKVKFYQYDGQNPSTTLSPLHEGIFDLRTEEDLVEVEKTLDYVKTEGWSWAS
ncbi:hypothetical protein N7488_009596 [Penicillium malachiteum]|nr:hypothetical protein N7488_009596 [Penicillium malachiteum]